MRTVTLTEAQWEHVTDAIARGRDDYRYEADFAAGEGDPDGTVSGLDAAAARSALVLSAIVGQLAGPPVARQIAVELEGQMHAHSEGEAMDSDGVSMSYEDFDQWRHELQKRIG